MARSVQYDNSNCRTRGGPRSGDAGSDHGVVRMSVSIAGVISSMAKGLSEQAAAGTTSGRLAVVESGAQAARDAATCYWYLIDTSGVDRAAHLCHSGLRHAETAEHRLERLPAPASADQRATAEDERWIDLHAGLDARYLARAAALAQELLEAAYPDPARREAATLALHAARDLLNSLGAVPTANWRNSASSTSTEQTGTGE